MATITLRKLPPELEEALKATAREQGWSLSRTVIRLLEERLRGRSAPTPRRGPDRRDGIDALAGTWSAEEAAEFDAHLAAQRRIDPELWD